MSRKSALDAWQSSNGDREPSKPSAHSAVTKPGAAAKLTHGSESYKTPYAQVSHPSAGTTTPAGKVSGDTKNDALSNPGRFSRNHTTVAEVKPDSQVTEAHECQEGTNMELTWTRYGHDKKNPKTGQQFKKNFNNPTDNPSDLKVKE